MINRYWKINFVFTLMTTLWPDFIARTRLQAILHLPINGNLKTFCYPFRQKHNVIRK
jgi:hypothetical protein